jgi:hypothetical protein
MKGAVFELTISNALKYFEIVNYSRLLVADGLRAELFLVIATFPI